MDTTRRTGSRASCRHGSALGWLLAALILAAAGALVKPAAAQQAQAATNKILTPAELQDVVGPIALYPDDLVGIVLPASTYPLQIVEAERFLDKRAQDPSSTPSKDWDDSVVALLNYPEVVQLLNNDLDWTWRLGTAVLNQRGDVLDAIQTFRARARGAGNLTTDTHQTVTTESDGSIAIAPANPQVIYVPYYEPERVVEYQPTPVYSYYPWAYPVYYYPYPEDYVFSTGFFWGVTSYFSIGWHSHLLHIHYYGHNDFPYFGWNYYSPYYVRNYINVNVSVPRGGYVWEPRHRYGDRPIVGGHETRVADDRPTPHYGPGFASPNAPYRQHVGARPFAPARPGSFSSSSPQYRGSERTTARTVAPRTTAPTVAPRTPREASAAGAGGRPNRQVTPPPRWSAERAPQQSGTAQHFTSTPSLRFQSGGETAPYRRIPAPVSRPQYTRVVPQNEYRGASVAPRFAAPSVRAAPPRMQSFAAAPSRAVPRGEGGSHRSGGGGGGGGGHHGGGHGTR